MNDEYMKNFGGAPDENWSEMTIDNEGVAWVLRSEAEVRIAEALEHPETWGKARAATKAETCPYCGSNDKSIHRRSLHNYALCTDPWHSPAPAPQKEFVADDTYPSGGYWAEPAPQKKKR